MTKMIETKINGRWTLKLPDHRANRPEWDIKNGGWEVERLDAMERDIKNSPYKNTLVLDIGMEEGDITALLAKWGAHVVGWEPNPKVWPNIKAIFDANNLELHAGWVGFASDNESSNSTGYLYWKGDYTGSGLSWPQEAYGEVIGDHGFQNLSENDDNKRNLSIDRMMKTVSDTTWHGPNFFGDGLPYLITIDVEGSELRVLKGAEKTLIDHSPIVYVSVHDAFMAQMYDEYAADMFKYMKDLGYKYKLLAYDHELHVRFSK